MSILKTKKGIGIPTVLGIVTFVIATVATLLTVAVNQSKLIDKSIESSEAYANAIQHVDATLKIIAREQNLEENYLSALGLNMGVFIDVYGDIYMISSMVTTSKAVIGYISNAAIIPINDELFSETKTILGNNSQITPTKLLSAFVLKFMKNELPGSTYPDPDEFTNFDSIINYFQSLANNGDGYIKLDDDYLEDNPVVSGHWFINGSVIMEKNTDLYVPPNRLLIIKGSLTMKNGSSIDGNVVVSGNVSILSDNETNPQYILGTLYVKGNVTSKRTIVLGTNIRPAFIFSESNISFTKINKNDKSTLSGVGYFLSDNFTAIKKTIDITGGVYVKDDINPSNLNVKELASGLNELDFYSFAIPTVIPDESIDPEDNEFIYTIPILN